MLNVEMRIFTPEQVWQIHEKTLEFLEKYGICMEYAPAVDVFKAHGAQVDGFMVKMPRALVEKAMQNAPSSFALWARDPQYQLTIGRGEKTVLGPVAGAVFVSGSQGHRTATFDDAIKFHKLAHTSDICNFTAAGLIYPPAEDSNEGLKRQLLTAIEYSSKPLLGLTQNENIAKMTLSALKAFSPNMPHYVMGVCNSLSPLKWDENMLGAIMAFAEEAQPLIFACCSMAGFTSPLTVADTVLNNNIEIVAGIVLAQLINPGTPVIYGNTSTATDMKSFTLASGGPECALIAVGASQMAEHYNVPLRCLGGLNDAKELDFQCGAEAATNMFFNLNNKTSLTLHGLGVMESFMSACYEKWVLDEELVRRIYRMQQGPGVSSPQIVDTMGAKGSRGNYINDDDTLENFREELHIPQIFDRSSYEVYAAKQLNIMHIAESVVARRIEGYEKPDTPKETLSHVQKLVWDWHCS